MNPSRNPCEWRLASIMSVFVAQFAICIFAFGGGQVDPGEMKELGERASKSWADYKSSCQNLQGTLTIEFRDSRGNQQLSKAVYRANGSYKQREVILLEDAKAKLPLTLESETPDYSFRLTKINRDSKWAVSTIAQKGSGTSKDFGFHIDLSHCLPFAIKSISLTELLNDPGFRPAKLSTDNGLAQLDFTMETDSETKNPELKGLLGGRLVLQPDRNWGLVKAHLRKTFGPTATETMDVTFHYPASDEQDLRLPTKTVWENRNSISNVVETITITGDLAVPDTLPHPDEFRLSYFGIDEPDWAKRGAFFPVSIAIGTAGIAIVIFGLFLMQGKRKAPRGVR